jgi:hypothetical protein
MAGYRDSVAKRVKAEFESQGYTVLSIRIEDNSIYIECDGINFIERLDDWM